jgi:hypothetical protein
MRFLAGSLVGAHAVDVFAGADTAANAAEEKLVLPVLIKVRLLSSPYSNC